MKAECQRRGSERTTRTRSNTAEAEATATDAGERLISVSSISKLVGSEKETEAAAAAAEMRFGMNSA